MELFVALIALAIMFIQTMIWRQYVKSRYGSLSAYKEASKLKKIHKEDKYVQYIGFISYLLWFYAVGITIFLIKYFKSN